LLTISRHSLLSFELIGAVLAALIGVILGLVIYSYDFNRRKKLS